MSIRIHQMFTVTLLTLFMLCETTHVLAEKVAHWTFNEGVGSGVYDAVGGNAGTLYGATWTMGALRFDGTNDYIDCGNPTSLNIASTLTVEAWINLSSLNGVIVRKSLNDYYQYRLAVSNGKLKGNLRLSGAVKSVTGNTTLVADTWYHVHMTYDGTAIKLYVNGILDACLTATGTIAADSHSLAIGCGDCYGVYFNGVIDEVSIYNHAMTDADITTQNYPYRTWDFNYFGLNHNLNYVTAGMTNIANDIAYWKEERGVMPLKWKGGSASYATYDTVSEMSGYWTNNYSQWPGIDIDEFAGPDAVNQFLGDCLAAAKQSFPHIYIAPYCTSISGAQMIAGLKKADKIQMETYESSGRRGYSIITNRYQAAIDNNLSNISLITLGINSAWIATPTELRRQLHFVRYTYPNSTGIGFFNNSAVYTDLLMADINNLLARFYIDPVLRLEPQSDGTVKVRNIGSGNSAATTVRIIVGGIEYTRNVPALASGASCIIDGGANPTPVTEYINGCYKLGPPQLYANEQANYRPNASAAWPSAGSPIWTLNQNFASNPIVSTEYDGSKVKAVYCSMNNTSMQNCEIQFDLSFNQIQPYGWFEIGLCSSYDDSAIRLYVYRGDNEFNPRMTVYITDSTGVVTHEEVAVNLTVSTYKVKVRYSENGYARVELLNGAGSSLWDTGEVPVYNQTGFDKIRFGVRTTGTSALSALEWDAAGQRMHLRGAHASYALDAYVDNIKVDCWQ